MKPVGTISLDETRVARVDPVNGRRLVEPTMTADPEHTEMRLPDPVTQNEQRKTTEFVPASGILATGEVTSAWSPGPTLADTARKNLSLARRLLGKRTRLVALSTSALAGAITLLLVFGSAKESDSPTAEEQLSPTSEIPAANREPAPLDISSSTSGEGPPGSLEAAVDSLIRGKTDDALAQWRRLKLDFPQDPVNSVAVKILSRENEGGGQ